MVKYKNECVGCPSGMGCLGSACPNMNVPHYYCDKCGEEIVDTPCNEEFYTAGNYEHLCRDCFNEIEEGDEE